MIADKHWTTHQLYRLVEKTIDGANRKMDTGAVFFDVAQVFDTVWHARLLYKLYAQEVPIGLIKLIATTCEAEVTKYELTTNCPVGFVLGREFCQGCLFLNFGMVGHRTLKKPPAIAGAVGLHNRYVYVQDNVHAS